MSRCISEAGFPGTPGERAMAVVGLISRAGWVEGGWLVSMLRFPWSPIDAFGAYVPEPLSACRMLASVGAGCAVPGAMNQAEMSSRRPLRKQVMDGA